jgi:hypothetical protein
MTAHFEDSCCLSRQDEVEVWMQLQAVKTLNVRLLGAAAMK